MECRPGCGACCISPSISSPIPGMPEGKPAGVRCIQLGEDNFCMIFGQQGRPLVCSQFQADQVICGSSNQEALDTLIELEEITG